MGVSGQRHILAALSPPPRGITRCPLYRRLGGPQGRSGRVPKISSAPEFDPGPSNPYPVSIPTDKSAKQNVLTTKTTL